MKEYGWPQGSDPVMYGDPVEENYDQQMKDSDFIFNAISSSGCDCAGQARAMILGFYIPDMTFSRAGISHALKRLETHYDE